MKDAPLWLKLACVALVGAGTYELYVLASEKRWVDFAIALWMAWMTAIYAIDDGQDVSDATQHGRD